MGERVAETVMRGKTPETLSLTELQLETEPLTGRRLPDQSGLGFATAGCRC